jgi:cytochrome c-type biogenesis protein CcmF
MHYHARPMIIADSIGLVQIDDTVYAQNLFVQFSGISENHKIKIGIKESESLIDFIAVKSYIFPYINLVWMGLITMALGIILSILKRVKAAYWINALVFVLLATGLIYMFLFAN